MLINELQKGDLAILCIAEDAVDLILQAEPNLKNQDLTKITLLRFKYNKIETVNGKGGQTLHRHRVYRCGELIWDPK